MITPYPYQRDIIETLIPELEEHGKALMVMASGTGKSITSALIAKTILNESQRVLFLCHNNDILRHAVEEFRKVFPGQPMGIWTGEEKARLTSRFWFASFQSMLKWKEALYPHEFDMLIVDEGHHSQAETYKEVITFFKPEYLLGMTATPDRMDGRDIREIFGDEREEATLLLPEAIAKQYVTHVIYKLMTIGSLSRKALRKLAKEVYEQGRRLSIKQINETIFIESRDDEIVKAILEHQGQGIVFCESILHAENFQKHLPGSEVYHSKQSTKKNRRALNTFKKGKLRFLLTVDKFNEGIDIPDAELVIFLRSTDSETIFLQQLGRGLRKSPNKSSVTILDFVANVERLEYVKQLLERVQVLSKVPLERNPLYFDGAGLTFDITEEIIDILDVLKRIQTPLYETYEEASRAALALGIKTKTEYKHRYKEDPRLPCDPRQRYSNDWNGWPHFLGKKVTEFYPTLEEASKAAKALGIKTWDEYKLRYKEDPHLPCKPERSYSNDWQGMPQFLGREVTELYPTLEEASKAAQALGIKTVTEYRRRYKEDPHLPCKPERSYSNDWISWPHFLRTGTGFYPTLEEASKAAQALGIKTQREYKILYKEDPCLPSSPRQFYSIDWKSMPHFLGTGFYPTLEEASKAAQALGIKTVTEYKHRYKEDPHLPSGPHQFYSNDWKSWPHFLGKKVTEFYPALEEASKAAKALGIKTWDEYKLRYKEDPRLPSNPSRFYSNDWQGMPQFLGREVAGLYPTLEEASKAAQALGIKTKTEYKHRYKEDPRLPSTPRQRYSNDWKSWPHFLGTKKEKS